MKHFLFFFVVLIGLGSLADAQSEYETHPIQVVDSGNAANLGPTNTSSPLPRNSDSVTPAPAPSLSTLLRSKDTENKARGGFDKWPHLLLEPSFDINGSGFGPVSVSISGGFSFEPKFLIAEGLATYDTAHKTNDGTVKNNKGHIRALDTSLFYRLPNYWFFGLEGSWSQLKTTNYMKESWGLAFGGGKDFFLRGYPTRAEMTYAPPNFNRMNGTQGLNFELDLPSPLKQHHFTYYEQVGLMFFHATITDPTDPLLTAEQKALRYYSASCIFGVRIRF
jgi:hypothetical protein